MGFQRYLNIYDDATITAKHISWISGEKNRFLQHLSEKQFFDRVL